MQQKLKRSFFAVDLSESSSTLLDSVFSDFTSSSGFFFFFLLFFFLDLLEDSFLLEEDFLLELFFFFFLFFFFVCSEARFSMQVPRRETGSPPRIKTINKKYLMNFMKSYSQLQKKLHILTIFESILFKN